MLKQGARGLVKKYDSVIMALRENLEGELQMKIFATSDIHGNRKIMDKLNAVAADVDLIL